MCMPMGAGVFENLCKYTDMFVLDLSAWAYTRYLAPSGLLAAQPPAATQKFLETTCGHRSNKRRAVETNLDIDRALVWPSFPMVLRYYLFHVPIFCLCSASGSEAQRAPDGSSSGRSCHRRSFPTSPCRDPWRDFVLNEEDGLVFQYHLRRHRRQARFRQISANRFGMKSPASPRPMHSSATSLPAALTISRRQVPQHSIRLRYIPIPSQRKTNTLQPNNTLQANESRFWDSAESAIYRGSARQTVAVSSAEVMAAS